METNKDIQSGQLLDENLIFNMNEICEMCDVSSDFIIEMVQFGVIQPEDTKFKKWQFSGKQLQRLRRALRLQQDFELTFQGVALTLELLEELEDLRSQVEIMEHHFRLVNVKFK